MVCSPSTEAPELQWTAASGVQRRTEFDKEEHLQPKGTVALGAILGLEVLRDSRQAQPRNDLEWP
jgi:hypothetical protein